MGSAEHFHEFTVLQYIREKDIIYQLLILCCMGGGEWKEGVILYLTIDQTEQYIHSCQREVHLNHLSVTLLYFLAAKQVWAFNP